MNLNTMLKIFALLAIGALYAVGNPVCIADNGKTCANCKVACVATDTDCYCIASQ